MINANRYSTIPQRFVNIAKSYSGHIAVKYKVGKVWQQFTYSQLFKQSENTASYLSRAGIKRGDAVIFPSVRSPHLCGALLGTLMAGGNYVFIDPNYPAERQRFIAEEVKAKVGIFENNGTALENLNVNWHQLPFKEDSGSPYAVSNDAEMAACVFFTSGSTGLPKGVIVPHRGIMRLVTNTGYISFSDREVFLQLSALSFDAATLEIWGALLNGATCVLHYENGIISPEAIKESIETQSVTTLWLTSSLYNTLVSEHPEVLMPVKQLLTGGEALSVSHIKKGLALLPNTQLFNGYGPTENTTFTTVYPIPRQIPEDIKRIPIGYPISGTTCELFDDQLRPLTQTGAEGELIAFGDGLALGYLNREELTAERFIEIVCSDGVKRKGYRTGDLAVKNEDGSYDFFQRNDMQVKIDGHRIEPGEIELVLNELESVTEARVLVVVGPSGQKRLAAYVVGKGDFEQKDVRVQLSEHFPYYMVPHFIIPMTALPKNQNGKLDESRLPDPFVGSDVPMPENQEVSTCWTHVLGRTVSADVNFLDAGGTSLEALQLTELLERRFGIKLNALFVFEFPTINSQVDFLKKKKPHASVKSKGPVEYAREIDFAIIGMACRFPGAANVKEYWNNLLNGKESVSFFTEEELSDEICLNDRKHSDYVNAKGIIKDWDKFDAGFFGITPIEADIMDPQQRIMLELCWHALENAGIAPGDREDRTGVFLGMNWARYYQQYVLPHKALLERFGKFNAALLNEPDFLSTRISYKLNLSGPSINVFTACSTGLVAVVQACSAIAQGQCQQALAGGISISTPVISGYIYQEGNMLSRDGHCRPFDANATGTTFNDGAGVVVLKPLEAAKAAGDQIYAIIKGFAANNDGQQKASFTAPSVSGQVRVYDAALERAGFDPKSVGFIETHGTATPLGDPIEVLALRQSYAKNGRTEKTCAIGSVKSNIGHTIHAAGIAGLIKAALSLKHNAIPPTLFFEKPNPKLELEKTPFFVNKSVIFYPVGSPRRAAVSSLGVGGTNAHVLLEEFADSDDEQAMQKTPADSEKKEIYSVLLSAKTQESLEVQIGNYRDFFSDKAHGLMLRDVAYTSAVGRKHFAYRAAVSGKDFGEIIRQLKNIKNNYRAKIDEGLDVSIGFLFSGQGAQRAGMGKWLYENNAAYRKWFDRGSDIVLAKEGFDLRSVLYADDQGSLAGSDINETRIAQPALFLFEYGLAQCLIAKGCHPDFFIGHSIGEFVAAALAGVFHFDDATALVARRGALMQSMPEGRMLVVKGGVDLVREHLGDQVDLAAVNAPNLIVISGPKLHIQKVARQLEKKGVQVKLLQTSHAFHSRMMEPIVAQFESVVAAVPCGDPKYPIYSTKTGKLLQAAEATSPSYWAGQLRSPVLFSDAVTAVAREHDGRAVAFLEVGPGTTLATLVSHHLDMKNTEVIAALPGGGDERSATELSECINRLWVKGFPVQWQKLYGAERVKKVSLPGYAFLGESHWLKTASGIKEPEYSTPVAFVQNNESSENQGFEMSEERHQKEIQQQLKSILEDITGYDFADADEDAHFSEVGLDSLLLTQVATAIDQKFDIGVTFRHLVEEYTCLKDLGEFIAGKVPMKIQDISAPHSDAQPDALQPATNLVPAETPIGPQAPENSLHYLVNAQLQIMQMQLQALSGGPLHATPLVLPKHVADSRPQSLKTDAASTGKTEPADKGADTKPKARHTPGTRITREAVGVMLTTAQREWVDDILTRYQKKFAGSKALAQKYRKLLADPRTVSGFNPEWKEIIFPIVTVKSKGSKLWDTDGNELIDISNGFGPIMFGHSPDFIVEAVKAQLEKGVETGPQSPLAGQVAELFCELTGNERCTFACSGSEAVIGALRLARTVTGRSKVVIFDGAYHGIYDEVITRPGRDFQALPAAPGIPREATSNMLVLPWGEPESLNVIKKMGKELAAVLVEPVQSRKPAYHSSEYIKALRDITNENETALILDEVVTGFRVHPGGIRKLFDIDADLATYGKVVGGGYPIGIIGGKSKFMDALDGGYWQYGDTSIPESGVTFFAGTFVRHPMALAVAKAVLTRVKAEGMQLYERIGEKTAKMAADAKSFIGQMNCEVTFEEFASFFYVAAPSNAHWGHLLFAMMVLDGIHIQQYRPNFLTTEHTEADVRKILSAFKTSVAKLIMYGLIDGDQIAAKKFLSKVKTIPPGARLGKNAQGEPAYFIEDPNDKGKYLEIG